MKKGKHEAASGGWQQGGDPFTEETPSQAKKTVKPQAKKTSGGWKSWGKGRKAGVITLCCVAALVLLVAGWWAMFVRAPDVKENDRPGVTNNNPNRKPGETDDPADGSLVTGRKDDYYTFLLIGRDTAGGGNTDTLILVSYDVPNGQVNMMSIPRDTAINVPWSIKKINSVYNAKESNGGGMDGLKQQVAYLTGVMPDRYVIIEWKAVGQVVEAVGGVEFDVPRNMNYDDPYQDLHIHFNKGMQTLNGQKAMELLRYRKDNKRPDGTIVGYDDIGRMNTQRDFLKAMAKKVLQLGNITKIGEFIDIFMENVETDLTLTEMMWFASKAISVDVDAMQSSTLPYIDVGHYRKGDYLFPNGEEIVPLVNEQFNPYNREITLSDLQILVRNKDGSCYVTSGELLATTWASPTSSGSSGTAGGGVSTTTPTGITADPNVPTNQQPETPEPPSEPELPPDQAPPDEGADNPSVTPDPDATPDNPDTGTPPATDPDTPPAETPAPEPSPGEEDPPVTDPGPADPPPEQEPPQEEPPEPVLPPDPVLPPE